MAKRRNFWPLVRAYCEQRGWPVCPWEMHVGGRVTRDGFGFIDAVALVPSDVSWMSFAGVPGVNVSKPYKLAIQFTDKTHRAARLRKVRTAEHAPDWLANGDRIEVWCFGNGPEPERIAVTAAEVEASDG